MNISPALPMAKKLTLRNMLKNSWTHTVNESGAFLQRPKALKNQVVIYAALVLVLSRMFISFGSAKEEKNPDKKNYKFSQFLETTFREGMGFINSYLVLRFVEKISRKGMNALFQTEWSGKKPPGLFKKIGKEIHDYIKRIPRSEHPQLETNPVTDPDIVLAGFKNKALYERCKPAFKTIATFFHAEKGKPKPILTDAQILEKNLLLLPAVCVGLPVTLTASGFLLEWFNQTHFNQVYKALNKLFRLNKGNNQDKAAHNASLPASPPVLQPAKTPSPVNPPTFSAIQQQDLPRQAAPNVFASSSMPSLSAKTEQLHFKRAL